ncbi:hypothetical protein E6O75_ATG02826 [Venturia nashicola]|uniref:Uncharacterized protein n=1 Tax=Venturia nashicola TaxID=86259 RepID=A0A4Z1PGM0_9PEZI|nr:hypothetical protein E6O75_ATG02826 [Venturia nashicola]
MVSSTGQDFEMEDPMMKLPAVMGDQYWRGEKDGGGWGDGIVMQLWLADSMGKAEGRESADMIAEAARRYESMFVPRNLVGDTVVSEIRGGGETVPVEQLMPRSPGEPRTRKQEVPVHELSLLGYSQKQLFQDQARMSVSSSCKSSARPYPAVLTTIPCKARLHL